MKNIHIIFTLFLSTVFAQVSVSDINRISNQQLDEIKEDLQLSDSPKKLEDKSNLDSIDLEGVEIKPDIIYPIIDSKYFGYNYFQTSVNFFDNILFLNQDCPKNNHPAHNQNKN